MGVFSCLHQIRHNVRRTAESRLLLSSTPVCSKCLFVPQQSVVTGRAVGGELIKSIKRRSELTTTAAAAAALRRSKLKRLKLGPIRCCCRNDRISTTCYCFLWESERVQENDVKYFKGFFDHLVPLCVQFRWTFHWCSGTIAVTARRAIASACLRQLPGEWAPSFVSVSKQPLQLSSPFLPSVPYTSQTSPSLVPTDTAKVGWF